MTREEARLVTQKIEEAEARAEARTDAMLERLVQEHKARSQATAEKTTMPNMEMHCDNTNKHETATITLEDINYQRKRLEDIRRKHRDLEEAVVQNARAFMRIDYAAAEKDRAAGKVSDKEWDDFMTWYGSMRSYYRMFMDKSYESEHRAYEQHLEKRLRDMEHTYQKQNSLLNRLRRSLFGGV